MGSCNLTGDSSLRSERRHIFNGTAVRLSLFQVVISRGLVYLDINLCCIHILPGYAKQTTW